MAAVYAIFRIMVYMENSDPELLKKAIIILFILFFVLYDIRSTTEHRRRSKVARLSGIDEMHGLDFEYWCAEYLSQRGFMDVYVTRGSNDFGVDIVARRADERYAIQCKRCSFLVSNKAVQEVYTGRKMYDCDLAAVITNAYFSDAAKATAEKVGVELWDRQWLLDNALKMK